jgi:hypothetical protein
MSRRGSVVELLVVVKKRTEKNSVLVSSTMAELLSSKSSCPRTEELGHPAMRRIASPTVGKIKCKIKCTIWV